jgi:hypothetical protein
MNTSLIARALPTTVGGYRAVVQEAGLIKLVSVVRYKNRNAATFVAMQLKKAMQA